MRFPSLPSLLYSDAATQPHRMDGPLKIKSTRMAARRKCGLNVERYASILQKCQCTSMVVGEAQNNHLPYISDSISFPCVSFVRYMKNCDTHPLSYLLPGNHHYPVLWPRRRRPKFSVECTCRRRMDYVQSRGTSRRTDLAAESGFAVVYA